MEAKAEQQLQEERAREREEEKRREEAEKAEEKCFDKMDEESEKNFLQDFVEYVKRNKVIPLEHLAQQFKLTTSVVTDRIKEMQANGTLPGVIEHGNFIYITQEELDAVANFVRQRGRGTITELAEHSNTLINLNSNNKT